MGAGITKNQEANARRNAVGKLADKLRKAGAQIEFVNGTRQTWRSAIARFNGLITVTIYSVCQRASNAECFIYPVAEIHCKSTSIASLRNVPWLEGGATVERIMAIVNEVRAA